MKLQELAAPKKTKQITKVMESYFGSSISVDKLNARQTRTMLSRVRGLIKEHAHTAARHTSERNPTYLKLVMMEQALAARLAEAMPAPAMPGGTIAKPTVATANPTPQIDPKLKAAQDKLKKGQMLSADEQQLINAQAAQTTESKLRRAYKMLKESEVQQAQVVLAAQDMVDKMQSMLEDCSEMQFKELPALVDSIKNQVGIDQAAQFNTDATAALTGLMQNLQGAKQQLDQALGVVTGQAPAPGAGLPGMDGGADLAGPGADMAAAGDDLAAAGDLDAAAGDDLDAAAVAASDEIAPPPSKAALGRGRR